MKLFTSKSTKKFADHPQVKALKKQFPDRVIAIGGGAVIDKAKIYCKKNRQDMVAIPTTGAGASETSHAVIWQSTGRKCSTDCSAVNICLQLPLFDYALKKKVREDTIMDMYAHFVESAISKYNKDDGDVKTCMVLSAYIKAESNTLSNRAIVNLGIVSGIMIQRYQTNIYHAVSYPLTGMYKVPHGRALKYALTGLPKRYTEADKVHILTEALTYPKIHNSIYGEMNMEKLRELLQW